MSFAGRTALITGAGSGIGRALALALGRKGARVVATDIDAVAAERVAGEVAKAGGTARSARLDVTDAAAVAAAVDETIAREGPLDLLFNNAGIAILGELRDMSAAQWRRIVDVNVLGVAHGVAAAYPRMVARGSGHIVNTASLSGLVPSPGLGAYSATKHAVVGLSRALRAEAAGHGVRVSVLCPGFVDTAILHSEYVKMDGAKVRGWLPFKLMTPDACAEATLRGVARNDFLLVMPFYARAFSLMTRLAPRLSLWFAGRQAGELRGFRTDGS